MKRLLLLLFLLPLLTAAAYAQNKLEEDWYSLLLESKTVGFLHQTTWRSAEGKIRSEIEQTMEIRRFGVPFSMIQTDMWIEEAAGELVSVISELDMNGQHQRVEARVLDGELRVQISRADGTDEINLPLEEEPRGLYAISREIADLTAGGMGQRELDYRLFSPETMKIEEFRVRAMGQGELSDSRGHSHRGVLLEEQTSGLPGVITTEVYDEQARLLYSKTPIGLELEILRLEGDPRATADVQQGSSHGGQPPEDFAAVFDLASLTVAVKGLENLRLDRTKAITVLFRGRGVAALQRSVQAAEEDLGSASGAADRPLRIVSTGQDAAGGGNVLILRLANRSPAAGRAESGAVEQAGARSEQIPPELRRYLKGGFHLKLEDSRLEELLDRCGAAGGGAGAASRIDAERILCLERLVYGYIEHKSLAYGFADLDEILSKREGDCTEHALLLVALLRKAGFPARIAYGLLLTESGFLGHAWVELFSGARWRWLDPSFPGGDPYGLKIRIGVMDPAEPVWASLSLTLLQVMGSVEAEILEAERR